jgi:hypothetical protein
MSKMKTPREFGEEILRDWDLGGAEYGPLDLLEVRIMRAMEQERERCAKVAEERAAYSTEANPSEADLAWKRCARVIAKRIREGT